MKRTLPVLFIVLALLAVVPAHEVHAYTEIVVYSWDSFTVTDNDWTHWSNCETWTSGTVNAKADRPYWETDPNYKCYAQAKFDMGGSMRTGGRLTYSTFVASSGQTWTYALEIRVNGDTWTQIASYTSLNNVDYVIDISPVLSWDRVRFVMQPGLDHDMYLVIKNLKLLVPDPDQVTCQSTASTITQDLRDAGTLNAGSTSAFIVQEEGNVRWSQVRFQRTITLATAVAGTVSDIYNAVIRQQIGGVDIFTVSTLVTINSHGVNLSTEGTIPLAGTTASLTLDYIVDIWQVGYGESIASDLPTLDSLTLYYPGVTTDTLLCDGGMEGSDEYGRLWWQQVNSGDGWGRFRTTDFSLNFLMPTPACGIGVQLVGANTLYSIFGTNFSPVMHWFTWAGGTMYWKFKYKSNYMGLPIGSPNVYLLNLSHGFVADLFGGPYYSEDLVNGAWTHVTGSASLSAGIYAIVLSQGIKTGEGLSPDAHGGVYYDDVAVSEVEPGTGCGEWLSTEDELFSTLTPSPSATATYPGTPTGTITPMTATPEETPFGPPPITVTPNLTSTFPATPSNTATHVTATLRPTGSATITTTGTITGTASLTATPHGTQGTPWNPYTSTPNPAHSATPAGTPAPTFQPWTGGNLPPTPGGTPGGLPGGGGGGTGGGWSTDGWEGEECHRPDAAWDIAWWIDYLRCSLFAFVAWTPSHSATLQAIPTMLATARYVQYVGAVRDGVNNMKTQVATYDWMDTGMDGINVRNGVNAVMSGHPEQIFEGFGSASVDVWDGAGLNLQASGGGSSGAGGFSKYCSTKLSTLLASRLAEGMCFALNVMRTIGYLPWVQFLFNATCIFGMIRIVLGGIEYYLPIATGVKTDG